MSWWNLTPLAHTVILQIIHRYVSKLCVVLKHSPQPFPSTHHSRLSDTSIWQSTDITALLKSSTMHCLIMNSHTGPRQEPSVVYTEMWCHFRGKLYCSASAQWAFWGALRVAVLQDCHTAPTHLRTPEERQVTWYRHVSATEVQEDGCSLWWF